MASKKLGRTTQAAIHMWSVALGAPGARLTSTDKNKLVSLSGFDTYSICANNAEIEGVIVEVEDTAVNSTVVNGTVNNGSGLGTIQYRDRIPVWLETAVPFGGLVVAGTPVAAGTKLGAATGYLPAVKAGAPTKFLWRLVSGTGAANSVGVIERI